jgi:long-subunit acyl-CoA synthetase (AMP-forming)
MMACTFHPKAISLSNAVGELAPNIEAKIVSDEEGLQEVKNGERGDVWIRAPNVMKGYWRKPEATMETVTCDGWLKTGDIGFFDENLHLYIVDRKKVSPLPVLGNSLGWSC